MNELVQSIVTLGGFGYLNFLIYSRIDNPDFGSETDKKLMILFYSSMNYGIYLVIDSLFPIIFKHKIFIVEILLTIILSVILTLLFPIISRILFSITNWVRQRRGLPKIENAKLSDVFFEKKDSFPMFIFSIPDNILISKGFRGSKNGINEEFSIINYNFYGYEPFCGFEKESEVLEYIEEKEIEANIYINFDKKIKIISFQALAEEEQEFAVDEIL